MKSKKFAIVVCILGILLIIGGLSYGCYAYINKQDKDQKEIENKILLEYDNFKKNAESFNELRSKTYYNGVAKNLYVESVESEYEAWIEILDKYTELTDKVENSSIFLKENCVNKYYSNENIRNKCDSFVIAYETTINYYTKDIISFNDTINSYLKKINEESENIKLYEQKYNYIDINLDGKFIGKE